MPIPNRKILNAGLNADDTDFVVAEGEYINAENIRWGTTDNGSVGHIEPIGSNIEIPYTLPAGTNICIGRCTDEARNRILYFNYNSNGDHAIYAYDEATGDTYVVMLDSDVTDGLGFDKDYIIHSAFIIGDLLFWTDNLNELRRLNTEAGIKLNDGAYSTSVEPYTSPLDQSVITVIRKPPALAPLANKATISVDASNAADFAGQFAYRYIFRDYEESVLSPISLLVRYNLKTDTYDAVNVTVSTDEFIEQDVQVVEMCVRYGNSGQFYVIKSWDKANADELAEINDHNAAITPLQYYFLNDKSGRPLGDAYSIKPSDAVPRKSATIEAADNRVFAANNLVGYNSPTKSSLTLATVTDTNVTWQNPVWKSGGLYQFGIRFRDKYKRQVGNIYTNSTFRVQIPERAWDITPYTKVITANLSNADTTEIPDGAHFYDILVTKNLRTRFFIQGASETLKYAMKDATTGAITFSDTYSAIAYGLAIDISALTAAGLGYSYQSGDVLNLFSDDFTAFNAKVIDQQGVYAIVQLQDLGNFTNPYIQTGFEIYTPYAELDNEPFYTYTNAGTINNPGTAFKLYNDVAFNLYGDTFIRTNPATSPDGDYEYMSNNEKFWQDWFSDWGEANFDFPAAELLDKTAIQYSNGLIIGTRVNGLSTFDSSDKKTLTPENGAIRRLVRTNKVQGEKGIVMLAICENETVSMYLGEIQMMGSQSNAFIASTPGVIGTVNVLKGSHGTISPESVIEHRGSVFWWDLRNSAIVQYSVNGLDVISDYKLRRFTRLYSEKFRSMTAAAIEALGGRPFIFGIVDKYHAEVMWSLPELESNPKGNLDDFTDFSDGVSSDYPYDFYDGQAKTIVYKIGADKWMGAFGFTTEMFATIGSNLYSFRNGVAWKHNDTASTNTFYDTQVNSKLMLLCNAEPLDIKTLISIAIEANIMPSFLHIRSEYPYIQSSALFPDGFVTKEGVHYGSVLRDRLSPAYSGSYNDIMYIGDKMRNTAFRIYMEWDNRVLTEDFSSFKLITFGYNKSYGQSA